MNTVSRRQFMAGAGMLGVAAFLDECVKNGESKKVSAIEDLSIDLFMIYLYNQKSIRKERGEDLWQNM